ncbi:MAG: MFS transporter [Chlorobi bacterium]|nr:MFS transporter [Chlorobiota bacterium]
MADKTFRTGPVATIAVAHFLHDIYSSFLAPVLPLLIEKLSLPLSLAGSLSIFQRIPALFNPLVGIMAEKVNSRYFIILTPGVTAVAMSLLGVAPGYAFLAVLLLIAGASSTFFHVPTPVMIKNMSGDRIGKGMSFFMLGGELARTMGPMVIIGAVSLFTLKGSWKIMPFGVLATFMLYYFFKDAEIRTNKTKNKIPVEYGKLVQKHRKTFLLLSGFIFFRSAMKSALTLYLPVFLIHRGDSLWIAAISLSVLQLAGAAGTFYSGAVSDKIGRQRILLIIAVVTPLLMLIFLQTHGIFSIFLLAIIGFFLISPNSVMLAVVQELETSNLAFLNSIYMTLTFFINSVMVVLMGWLADHFGLEVIYLAAALFGIPAIFFALVFKDKQLQNH